MEKKDEKEYFNDHAGYGFRTSLQHFTLGW